MKFTTKHIAFKTRALKSFGRIVLLIFLFSCLALFKDNSTWHLNLIIISVSLGVYLIYDLITRERTVVTQVEFIEQQMIISGYRFNTPFQVEFNIPDASIQIKSQGKGRGNVEYYLRVSSQQKIIKISYNYNWNYTALVGIFHEFKRIKGEKIIFDEKYFLDIMEKKANSSP